MKKHGHPLDSWYANSVIYSPRKGQEKGRPAEHGAKTVHTGRFQFFEEKVGNYCTAVKRVLTNLFGNREVLAYVTAQIL